MSIFDKYGHGLFPRVKSEERGIPLCHGSKFNSSWKIHEETWHRCNLRR